MSTTDVHPTSFRFTEDDLECIDELVGALIQRNGTRFPVSRKTAVMIAVDLAIEHYVNGKARATRNPA